MATNKHNRQKLGTFLAASIIFILSLCFAPKLMHKGYASQLNGDINGDGAVNISDLAIMAAHWGLTSGATWSTGDLNGDGAVNISDLAIMATHWGDTLADLPAVPSGLSATPESATTVNLSWSADSGSDGTVTYLLYRNGTEITSTTSLTYGDSGLTNGDTYDYTIAASDDNGTSDQSSQVDATTLVASCQTVTIPAYYDPDGSDSPWAAATTDNPGGIMIANPDSGPYTLGYWDEAGYPAAEAAAEAAGIQVYGYVDSDYMIDPSDNGANGTSGDRSNTISDIEAQINTWLSYGIKNIFFDEVTDGINNGLGTDPNNSTDGQPNTFVEDYQELTAYVHANGGKTILNPGDVPAQSYMNAGDIVSIFEDDYSTYETTTFPSWVKSGGYNPDQFYNIIYNVPNATDMASVLSQAESDGIQNVYVTNLSLSNPYDANPSYLSTEANDAASNCSL